jgi:hypothetical protein
MSRRKSSEPACRVCGCTEYNACNEGCSWVRVEKNSPPLCSACSGTAADMAEAIKRGMSTLIVTSVQAAEQAVAIGRAALRRQKARAQLDAENIDPAWGGR